MSICVYRTADGSLYSEIPDSVTIADAQASGLLASNDVLAANGLAAIDGQTPLSNGNPNVTTLVVWSATTKTTTTIAAPTKPIFIATYQFILLFTPAEHAAIIASTDQKVQQFLMAITTAQQINLNDPVVQGGISYLVSINLLTQANATLILSGQPSQ